MCEWTVCEQPAVLQVLPVVRLVWYAPEKASWLLRLGLLAHEMLASIECVARFSPTRASARLALMSRYELYAWVNIAFESAIGGKLSNVPLLLPYPSPDVHRLDTTVLFSSKRVRFCTIESNISPDTKQAPAERNATQHSHLRQSTLGCRCSHSMTMP